MLKKIEQFLTKKSSDLIGIDIGTGSIKLVEIAWQKGQPVLKNFGIIDVPNKTIEDGRIIDTQQLSFALNQLLATTRTTSKNVVVAVGGRVMFARELIFPKMTTTELKEAIKWDVGKYIPYTPGSYYFDFSIVGPGNTEAEIKVLLVASPLENITNILNAIKGVGLKPIAVDVEPLALYRIFKDAEKSMVIDIGDQLSQITVFQNGSPAVIRNIPIGGRNFTQIIMKELKLEFNEAEKFKQNTVLLAPENVVPQYSNVQRQMEAIVNEFAQDITRTAEYYQQQNKNVMINNIFITGGGAKLRNIIQSLTTKLAMPAILYDPLSKLKIPGTFDKVHLQKVAPQLGTAIGLALRGGGE